VESAGCVASSYELAALFNKIVGVAVASTRKDERPIDVLNTDVVASIEGRATEFS
jgi:hypothetical protein